MTEYMTEQEQIELLKNWLKQYGFVIVMGIIFALIATTAWHVWQERQVKVKSHASVVFDDMINARAQNHPNDTQIQARKLFKHYSSTAYGPFATLMLARSAIVKKNYAEAEKQLTWAMDNSDIASIRQIARLRLARLMLTEKKYDQALKILNRTEDKTFMGLIDEVRGDIYLAKKDTSQARASYQLALTELPNAQVVRPLLQMKYDNLITN